MTGLVITAVLFPLVGAATRRLAGGGPRFLLGVGVVGMALYATMLIGIAPRPVLIALVVASVAILFVARRRDSEPEPRPRSVAATVVTIAPLVVLLFITAFSPLLDFDGRAFWVLKAKAIATERAVDGPFFLGQAGHNPKNEYPLLIPIAGSAVMTIAGSLDDFGIRWLYVLSLGSLALHARRWVGAWPAALITWIPQFAIHSAQSAYNDVFIAAFAALAFFEIVSGSPVRFGLWISFLALTKNEGLPFAVLLLVVAAIVWRRRVVPALLPFAVAVTTVFVWRLRVEPTDDDPLVALFPTLPERLERLVPAIVEYSKRAFDFDRWGIFWMAVAAAIALLVVQRRWREVSLALVPIFGMSGVYVAAYMVTTWQLIDHVNTSADRLLMHFIGPCVYLLAAASRSGLSVSSVSSVVKTIHHRAH